LGRPAAIARLLAKALDRNIEFSSPTSLFPLVLIACWTIKESSGAGAHQLGVPAFLSRYAKKGIPVLAKV